jgi:homopolymeric O-antigen transport system ATP-binding protein
LIHPAISVRYLSKRYRIGSRAAYRTLREELVNVVKAPLRLLRKQHNPHGQAEQPHIWALEDVSFELHPGQALGVIGRNGAGKSTLLKVLSRITAPTRGTVDLYGRVGSLLEVGTGFHHELTGRENIYLNGAILGMRKVEIERKFDEIVDFGEVEKFIDTPVKFYSNGMYMRLAFSVAAHLEPEILLVDEVLAVGDATFQKKCLGKMGDITGHGRTVVFVSHQMNAIQDLCTECIWLDQGRLVQHGSPRDVVTSYLGSGMSNTEWVAPEGKSGLKNPYFTPTRFALVDAGLKPLTQAVRADEPVGVLIEGMVEQSNIALTVGFAVYAVEGTLLFESLHTDAPQKEWPPINPGFNRLLAWLPPHLLNEGSYRVELHLNLHWQEWLSRPGLNAPSLGLEVQGGLSQSPYWMMARPGILGVHIPFIRLDDEHHDSQNVG